MKNILLTTIFISFSFVQFIYSQVGPVNYLDTTSATAATSMIAIDDINNDGLNEVITSIAGASGKIGYFNQQSNGHFTDTLTIIKNAPFAYGLKTGDFNNDGFRDIIAIGGMQNEAWLFMNDGGNFPTCDTIDSGISILMNDLEVQDFDGDNDDDIVIIGQHSIDLYRNDGNAIFTKEIILSTSSSSHSLECLDLDAADMNNDGHIDLICAETEGVVLYINDGNGVFTPNYYSQIPEIGILIESIDVDNDNDVDVIMTTNSNDTKLFLNDGNGSLSFSHILSSIPTLKSLSSIDYNNDGLKDLYLSYEHTIAVFLNDTQNNFNTEVEIHHDTTLIMGYVCTGEIDHQNGEDYIWSGGNKKLAYHINQSSLYLDKNFLTTPKLIYPNPSSSKININAETPIIQSKICSIDGALMLKSNKHSIDIRKLQKGSYILIIETKKNTLRKRFIKQ
ncbi:FG-GAP-like repeat-containing protein [Brumimicrobium aurantiacum]|uniref:T9SS C-terminal target domain-containing protein n=1 Tax=Brumimicrobium aurantiacum TaxID=1737063 RepID=A0A3E1EV62_9FLAO|nr:FG-GAP-like repeat-containing protein [Brumimicrobium aurantiacum]RFC53402.1 T9SS C-terminal target domain-containing protein [Brumimicrobium aurantiacum]